MTPYHKMSYWKNLFSRNYADLKDYSTSRFSADLGAGLVTGIVAIPLSLALAIATGVPPVYGLYTAAIAGITASVLGGSRFSVSGPAAAMVPILAAIVNEHGVKALPAIGLFAGIFLIIMGIGKLGKLVQYVPLPVVLGFTAGVALTIFTGQLNGFLGLTGIHPEEHFHEKFAQTVTHVNTVNPYTVIIGVLALTLLIVIPKIGPIKKLPASLFAVILTTLIVALVPAFNSVKTIAQIYGTIPTGLHFNIEFSFDNWPALIQSAFKVAFLIGVESLLCAVVADKMTKTRHNSNVELVAQGVANLVSPLFGGIPATAVIARTGTSIKSGATSRLAGIIHGLVVLIFIVFLAKIGSLIPIPTLAAVLFITAWKISEQKEIRHLFHVAPKADLAILLLTFGLTVFIDLTVAVAFGMVMAMLLFFKNSSTIHAEHLDLKSEYTSDELSKILKKHKNLMFINLEGNLTMGAAHTLLDQIQLNKNTDTLVLRFREVHSIDLSGLESLRDLVEQLHKKEIKIIFTSMNPSIHKKITHYGLDHAADVVYPRTARFIEAMK